MDDSKLRGPILALTMEQLVDGHPEYFHDFQSWINNLTDKIGNVAEYHVRLKDGKFAVYYLTFEDQIPEGDLK